MLDKERVWLVNVIRALANGLVFSNAMAFRFLLQKRCSFSAQVIYWIVFATVLIVVNGWCISHTIEPIMHPEKIFQ